MRKCETDEKTVSTFLAGHPEWKHDKFGFRRSDGLNVSSEAGSWWLGYEYEPGRHNEPDSFAFWKHAICYADEYYPLGEIRRIGGKGRLDEVGHHEVSAQQQFDYMPYEHDRGGVARPEVRKEARKIRKFWERSRLQLELETLSADPDLEKAKDVVVASVSVWPLILFAVSLFAAGFLVATLLRKT